jgi:hypothetical protein
MVSETAAAMPADTLTLPPATFTDAWSGDGRRAG